MDKPVILPHSGREAAKPAMARMNGSTG